MELLIIILLILIGILAYFLLKKERVLGINVESEASKEQIKVIESIDYRKNIYDLLHENYIALNETKTSFNRELDKLMKMFKKNIIIIHKNNIINVEEILAFNTRENRGTHIII